MPPQYPEMETESGPVVAEDGDPQASGGDLVADGTPQVKTEEPGQAGSVKREPEEDEATSAAASTSKDPAKSADFNPFKGKSMCCLLKFGRDSVWWMKNILCTSLLIVETAVRNYV